MALGCPATWRDIPEHDYLPDHEISRNCVVSHLRLRFLLAVLRREISKRDGASHFCSGFSTRANSISHFCDDALHTASGSSHFCSAALFLADGQLHNCDDNSASNNSSLQHCGVKSQSEIRFCKTAATNLNLRFGFATLRQQISI